MAWNPNIPQATDALSQSQSDILANFQALDALFDGGIQNFVLLPVQSSGPTTTSTEVALYSKISAATSNQELFFRRVSSGVEIECTSSGTSWTRLPSGILLKWGAGTASGNTTVTFPGSPVPAFNNVFAVLACPTSANIIPTPSVSGLNYTVVVWQYGTTGFQIWGRQLTSNTNALVPYNYLAIGN